MENNTDSPLSDTWRTHFTVRPAQCKGNCDLTDGAAMLRCSTCGWDDWIGDANPTEGPKVVGAGSSSDSQYELKPYEMKAYVINVLGITETDNNNTNTTMEITQTAQMAWLIAKEKGFHPDGVELNVGQMLMLIVSELGEAMEADRKGKTSICGSFSTALIKAEVDYEDHPEDWKRLFELHVKDTFQDEIADAVIRLFDLAIDKKIDLEWHIRMKMQYNKLRPALYGKKY